MGLCSSLTDGLPAQSVPGAPRRAKISGLLPPSGAHFCRASALVTISIRPDIVMHTGSVRIGPAHESRFKSQPYLKSLANSPDALATAAASFRSRLCPGRYGLEKRLNTFAALKTAEGRMSALGQERTFRGQALMSASPRKADIDYCRRQVCV